MDSFKSGQMVVYPGQGVGIIEGHEQKEIVGQKQSFYILRILDNDVQIMVPTNNTDRVGLRKLIDKKEIRKIFTILRTKSNGLDNSTWNRRYRDYLSRLKTGLLHDVAAVNRDLYHRSKEKELSYGERKMLENAKSLLITELLYVSERPEKDIEERIERALEKA